MTPWEIPRFIRGNNVSLAAMNDELLGLRLADTVPWLDVPVFFFLGRYDHHVDAETAAQYLDALQAPLKRVVWFENSAHNIPFEEPAAFTKSVVEALHSIGIGTLKAPPVSRSDGGCVSASSATDRRVCATPRVHDRAIATFASSLHAATTQLGRRFRAALHRLDLLRGAA